MAFDLSVIWAAKTIAWREAMQRADVKERLARERKRDHQPQQHHQPVDDRQALENFPDRQPGKAQQDHGQG